MVKCGPHIHISYASCELPYHVNGVMEKESNLLLGIHADREWIEVLAKFVEVHPVDIVILAIGPVWTPGSLSMCTIRRNSPRSRRRA